ncbi:Fe,Mn superoxide dismutase, putative [Babesia bigemina]|uniref:Superoxide dismutase n=1 Tax=Babesia bigemina TaxID=5866 RepID=A0A061D5W8_BABBI|nr:Fe,Mn superoxide dismutase, putative [Babesia bigemina]CDR96111.1 Fe,Mn superoxide dismutase, putative [Babesia bigemina]|eukprot:XP_012768297.1 Fe,Mn superoxide dismutase, putative [Babesia bigemina]
MYVRILRTHITSTKALNALEPHISEETIRYHYLKHHAGYVKKLNELAVKQPEIATKTLDELLETAQGTVYNMAAQVWNHDFYWLGMSPNGSIADAPMTNELINKTFGSHEALKQQITQMATGNIRFMPTNNNAAHFGSGWVWATYDRVTDTLKLAATKDADNPIRLWMVKPVLVIDVWEHAYYIDYRNDKSKYTDAWFKVINWERAEQLIQKYRSE